MSNDRDKFKQRIDDIWKDAMKGCGGHYEIAEYNFSNWVDDELHTLKPSQYAEFIEVAKENGPYIPGEERDHWTTHFSKDELEGMGYGE